MGAGGDQDRVPRTTADIEVPACDVSLVAVTIEDVGRSIVEVYDVDAHPDPQSTSRTT